METNYRRQFRAGSFSFPAGSFGVHSIMEDDTIGRVHVFGEAVMLLSQTDLEAFQAQHPDHRLELVSGKVIVMRPSGYESDEVAAEAIRH